MVYHWTISIFFDIQNNKINKFYLKIFFLIHINTCNFHKSLIFFSLALTFKLKKEGLPLFLIIPKYTLQIETYFVAVLCITVLVYYWTMSIFTLISRKSNSICIDSNIVWKYGGNLTVCVSCNFTLCKKLNQALNLFKTRKNISGAKWQHHST